ncbi:LysR family transcriptional regulator [Streptomyces microflavus]|uniref:Transcriptional regulator, LysR family n=2 Tax=Streptomyces microflavus TaxID=1919 RepID=N0CVY8_STRMI|nr:MULTISPECIES: LysR family transcriptional regulator [Streptomyces]AGK77182.1 Transcriptional regulator, LysR family [Streptomyces microflavus DSM 40593]MDX2977057.1 LysR family transcriptional regulator [Streptomyces sp. NRRL_B-2249]WSS36728.1 LysR family transcriptional regulator [Streptomyces microflavus]WST14821.1 LysR family transcriptional regulator [Streptomyces microflavus]SCK17952.1 DNA-binding transcriptional regulator, LysR family [Streptomyces sp. ScaeMP-e48]
MTEWDVKKLRILRTLRDRGTVTATAEALLMTPSAVSQQLTNLARQLGVELLEPQGRRVRLTDAAHLVLRHAEAVFAQLERADAELTGYLRGEAGEVRVGAFSTAVPALVVPAVRLLRAEGRPGPDVRVREAEAAQAYELLTAGEVDLALSLAAHAPTARDPRFSLFPLLADPLDVALPAGHPLADAPALRLADLAADRWIFGGSGPWSEITTAACEAAGFVPEQAHSAAGWTAILALVEAGMGVALVPRMASREQRREGVVMRVLEADRPRRHVVAAVRHGASSGPAVARVLKALTDVAASFGRDGSFS